MIKKAMALDWRAMKYYQIRGFLLPPLAFLCGVIYSPILVIPMIAFMGASYSINTFAIEEKGELNNLYLTLPISRRQIVIGRYALSFVIYLAGLIIGIPIMIISNTISFSQYFIGFQEMVIIIAMSFLMYSAFNIFMFPILFKLGYQKGKMWGFYLPVILFSLVVAGYYSIMLKRGNETILTNFISQLTDNIYLFSGGLIILSIVLLIASYMISTKLYSKRSF